MGGKATFPLGRQHHSMDGLQGHKTISSERCKNSLWTKAVEEENHEFKYTCKPLPPHWLPHLSSWAWQTYGVCPSSQLRSWSHCSWGMEICQSTLYRFAPAMDQMLSAWQPMDCWKCVCWSTLCLCVCEILRARNLCIYVFKVATVSKFDPYILQVFQKEISHMVLICFPSKLLRHQKSSNWYLERIKYIQLTKKRGLAFAEVGTLLDLPKFHEDLEDRAYERRLHYRDGVKDPNDWVPGQSGWNQSYRTK